MKRILISKRDLIGLIGILILFSAYIGLFIIFPPTFDTSESVSYPTGSNEYYVIKIKPGPHFYTKVSIAYKTSRNVNCYLLTPSQLNDFTLMGTIPVSYLGNINGSEERVSWTLTIGNIELEDYILLFSTMAFSVEYLEYDVATFFPIFHIIAISMMIVIVACILGWGSSVRSKTWGHYFKFVRDEIKRKFLIGHMTRLPRLKRKYLDLYCIDLGRIFEALCIDYTERNPDVLKRDDGTSIAIEMLKFGNLIDLISKYLKQQDSDHTNFFNMMKGLLDEIREARNAVHPSVKYQSDRYDSFFEFFNSLKKIKGFMNIFVPSDSEDDLDKLREREVNQGLEEGLGI